MNTLAFMPMLLGTISREAATAYPNEMCGILIGRDAQGPAGQWRLVERITRVPNAVEPTEQYHRFQIDPKTLLAAERDAADHGQIILGFYHSHPDHPARPSAYDALHAWPVYSYLIVSVPKGKPADITAWRFHDQAKRFVEQAIVDETPVDTAMD